MKFNLGGFFDKHTLINLNPGKRGIVQEMYSENISGFISSYTLSVLMNA